MVHVGFEDMFVTPDRVNVVVPRIDGEYVKKTWFMEYEHDDTDPDDGVTVGRTVKLFIIVIVYVCDVLTMTVEGEMSRIPFVRQFDVCPDRCVTRRFPDPSVLMYVPELPKYTRFVLTLEISFGHEMVDIDGMIP